MKFPLPDMTVAVGSEVVLTMIILTKQSDDGCSELESETTENSMNARCGRTMIRGQTTNYGVCECQ